MDAAASWQAFACTGNILRYLDYKQLVQLPAEHPAGETDDGTIRDHGSGTEGEKIKSEATSLGISEVIVPTL